MPLLRPLALTLLLSGCVSTEYLYDRADWFVMKEISDHVCPHGERRGLAERHVDRLMAWHRTSELPRYARALRQLAEALETPVTTAEVRRLFQAAEGAWKRIAAQIDEPVAEFLGTVTDVERQCLARRFEEDRKEAGEALDEPDWREERLEKLVDRIEDFAGDLSEEQVARIGAIANYSKERERRRLAIRDRGRAALMALLDKPSAERRAAVLRMFHEPDVLYGAADRKARAASWRALQKRVVDTLQVLTAEQRERVRQRLLKLAGELDAISRKRG